MCIELLVHMVLRILLVVKGIWGYFFSLSIIFKYLIDIN